MKHIILFSIFIFASISAGAQINFNTVPSVTTVTPTMPLPTVNSGGNWRKLTADLMRAFIMPRPVTRVSPTNRYVLGYVNGLDSLQYIPGGIMSQLPISAVSISAATNSLTISSLGGLNFNTTAWGSGWVNRVSLTRSGSSTLSLLKGGQTITINTDTSAGATLRWNTVGIRAKADSMFLTPETLDSISVGEVLTVVSKFSDRAHVEFRPSASGGGAPTGAAGGDLTGTYPNPTIGNNKVISANVLDGTLVNADLASQTVDSNKVKNGAITYVKLAQPVKDTISSKQRGIQFKDEGTNAGTSGTVTSVDFTGSGVTASRTENALTVNVTGGGGTTTLNQAIQADPIFKETIYQDSILVPSIGGATTNGLFQITPLDSTEHSAPFLFGHSATKYATGTNHVMYMGWNLEPGGGKRKAGYPAIGEGWENRWRPDGSIDYTEKHEVWGTTDDTLRRISSWTLDNTTKEGSLYHVLTSFNLRKRYQGNRDFFIASGNGNGSGSGVSIQNLYGAFQMSYDKTSGSNSNTLTFSNSYNTASTAQYNISGFSAATWSFASLSLPTASYFVYGDGTYLQNQSGSFRIYSSANKPINFEHSGLTSFQVWKNSTTGGVNIGSAAIGTEIPSAVLNINNTSKGVLLSRLTTTQRDAISSPATSLLLYNTTDSMYQYHDGLRYRPLSWGYKGNYVRAVDFIGSTNAADVVFRRNSIENMRLTNNGLDIGRTVAGSVTNNAANLRIYHSAGGQFPYAGISIDHNNTLLTNNNGGSFISFTRRDSTQGQITYDYLGANDTRTVGSLQISNDKNGDVMLKTNGSNRMVVRGSGNVGIGYNTPQLKFVVNNNTNWITNGNDPKSSSAGVLLVGANSTPMDFQIHSLDTFSRVLFTVDHGGFGIGQTVPKNRTLAAIGYAGNDGTSTSSPYDVFKTKAASTWSSSSRSTITEFYATAIGSTTATKSVVVEPDGLRVVSGTIWLNDAKTVGIFTGSGTPEGSVSASVGSTFHRTDGGSGTSFYVKESGTGNTGWVAK